MLSIVLRRVMTPLLVLFIFMLSNGLMTALIPLRLHLQHQPDFLIGAMAGFFYGGIFCASFRIERFIIRVGHIRAFAALAALLTVTNLLYAIFLNPYLWLLFRFFGGVATAGLFVVIESWLLINGTENTRGQVIGLYMIVLYTGQGLGPFLLNVGNPLQLLLFVIAAILTAMAIVPLAATTACSPQFEEPSRLSFKQIYRQAASAVIGCWVSGLLLGALYGLLPVFAAQQSLNAHQVSWVVASLIIGGMSLQYPIGRLSDYIERRLVLVGVCGLTALISVGLMILPVHWYGLCVLSFMLGGMTFTVYPLSISYGCDSLDTKDIVAGTQGMQLAYSMGATTGPLLVPLAMHWMGTQGFPLYCAAVSIGLVVFLLWRRFCKDPLPQEDTFLSLPHTTPIASELDPRGDE